MKTNYEIIKLRDLSKEYGYDENHNLRYLALRNLILKFEMQDILVLGCGLGIVELLLPDSIRCVSYDIDEQVITIARKINEGKKKQRVSGSKHFDY